MKLTRDVALNVVTPRDPVTVEVVENQLVTDSSSPHYTRHWVVDVGGTPLENNFQVGQAFGVIPEWEQFTEYNKVQIKSEDRKLRLYSIASPSWGEEGNGRLMSTTVKRVFDEHWDTGNTFLGVCSNYMCDIDEGDTVKVTGPTGKHFLLPDEEDRDQHNYLFLAAGTGIAPFRGMVIELLEQGVDNDIWLILGVPYSTDLLYGEFFQELEKEHDNFHFIEAISREQRTDDGKKMYVQERLLEHDEVFRPLLQDDRTLLYICGLKGMETGIYRSLLLLDGEQYVQAPADPGEVDIEGLSARNEFFDRVKPVKDRTRVEVY